MPKKTGYKALDGMTVDDIMAHKPCYDRAWVKYKFAGRKTMTIEDVLLHAGIDDIDAMWLFECVGFFPQEIDDADRDAWDFSHYSDPDLGRGAAYSMVRNWREVMS